MEKSKREKNDFSAIFVSVKPVITGQAGGDINKFFLRIRIKKQYNLFYDQSSIEGRDMSALELPFIAICPYMLLCLHVD